MNKTTRFRDYHLEKLKDPQESKRYLEVALEEYEKDRDTETFLLALRDVAEARGGIGKLTMEANLNRQNLYKALSKKGNPKIHTVGNILRVLGFRLSVEVLE
jgi:probable addiction module antidote protein